MLLVYLNVHTADDWDMITDEVEAALMGDGPSSILLFHEQVVYSSSSVQ